MFHIDLARTFEIAKAARYRGYFSMEYDAEGDPVLPTEGLIQGELSESVGVAPDAETPGALLTNSFRRGRSGSRLMTLLHAATKSFTNASFESSDA